MARAEWASTTRLIHRAAEVLAAESPMTVRQTFYRLVSARLVENCLSDYQRVSKALTKARNDGRIAFSGIVDRSRPTYQATTFQNLGDYSEAVLAGYRRDHWQDQPRYVEVWCEKDAVTGSIEEVTDSWGVPLRAMRGFNSTTHAHDIAKLFRFFAQRGKAIAVFYLGDWDASGEAIEKDVQARVTAYRSGRFDITRLAISREDIAKFHLPPLRVKPADPRAKSFIRQHGREAVELDALPPTELRARVNAAVEACVDRRLWKRALEIEEAQRATTKLIADRLAASEA